MEVRNFMAFAKRNEMAQRFFSHGIRVGLLEDLGRSRKSFK